VISFSKPVRAPSIGRKCEELGHQVKIISPQYVKPFVRRQKNDGNDAEAPHYSRAKDHRRPLVGPAVLRPQAAAAELLLKRESGPWPGLIPRAPLSPQRCFAGFKLV
jgi:transposase